MLPIGAIRQNFSDVYCFALLVLVVADHESFADEGFRAVVPTMPGTQPSCWVVG